MERTNIHGKLLDDMMVLLVVFPVVPVEDVPEERADVSVPGQLLFNIFRLGLTYHLFQGHGSTFLCNSYWRVFIHEQSTYSQHLELLILTMIMTMRLNE